MVRLVLLAALSASNVLANPVVFPGGHSELVSPSGQLAVVWREENMQHPHELLLRFRGGHIVKIMQFARNVEVVWAPNSTAFAVDDNYASDASRLKVFAASTSGTLAPIAVHFPSSVNIELATHDHAYVSIVGWSKAGLALKVWGYNPGSFSQRLLCTGVSIRSLICT